MSFNGNEGAFITLSDGATLTANYRSGKTDPVLGHYVGKSKLKQLINQTGAMGVRIYYGQDSSGNPELVIVGVDANENDMLGTSPLILDQTVKCPPTCGSSNSLNS